MTEAAGDGEIYSGTNESGVPGIVSVGSLQVVRANTAGRMTRIVDPLLRWTVRLGIDLALQPVLRGWVAPRRLFALTSYTDAPAALLLPPRGTHRRPVRFDGFRAEWVWHRETAEVMDAKGAAILYFHGGAFMCCGLNTHRRLVAKIGQASGLPVFSVDYRQLPKATFPETVDDCVTAYRHLLDEGFPAERIILSGDSAGGCLTFSTALAIRDRGLPTPAGLAALSPVADMDSTARHAHPNRHLDPALSNAVGEVVFGLGYAVDGKLDPAWSPVNHDFSGLPPVLIQVGSTESLLPDCEALARRCAEANVECLLQIWDRAPHVFQAGADVLPDARHAISEIAAFNRRTVAVL
ncbi:alpha/beta hydrolase [Nocardia colli]|uniref:alpha/beta hydrolase n=1 Tax=Nocardia colli TaxID=2545717 RepID=UPI0035D77984